MAGRHPRWTFHFTSTNASLLNAVEGLFVQLSKRQLKRGVFHLLISLQPAINRFVAEPNAEPRPFRWTKAPDTIITALRRGHQALHSIQKYPASRLCRTADAGYWVLQVRGSRNWIAPLSRK